LVRALRRSRRRRHGVGVDRPPSSGVGLRQPPRASARVPADSGQPGRRSLRRDHRRLGVLPAPGHLRGRGPLPCVSRDDAAGAGMFSVYGVARTVGDPMAGLLAAFFLGTAPFVVYSLLTFQLDLPLMAMVALALYMLIRTERFSRPGWTAALGLVWGLGLLTKPTFPVYACPPLLWTLGEAMWSGRRWRRLLWIGLAGAIAVVVAFPWYSSRLLGMPLQFMNRSFKFAEQEGHAPTL